MTVTFSDTRKPGTPETPDTPAEGSIRKVDADDPAKGPDGAIIKITGVDNNFSGPFMSREGGYITDVPRDTMPVGSYVAEEVAPPEGYSLSPDPSKVRQIFVWDGKRDVSLIFENDSKVKAAAQVGNDLLIHGASARSSDDVRNNKADGAKGHSQRRSYVNRKSRKP